MSTVDRASFTRDELAKALDDHLPRMAFWHYGQFYNDDPDFDVEAYYERVAEAIVSEALLRTMDPAELAES